MFGAQPAYEPDPAEWASRSFYGGAEGSPSQPFYRWNSPPGLVRVLEGVGLLLCLVTFACAASTLAWDYGGYGSGYYGMGGYGMGYGSGYYGGGYGMGYYGATLTPRSANGFMVAVSALCFLALVGLAGAGFTRSPSVRSRRFFLATLALCAVLAAAVAVASVVYVVGVNPRSQMYGSGGYYYGGGGANPMLALCNQAYAAGTSGAGYINQYLYHYCVVDPQEAIAMVCGFLLVLLLCGICFFAHKTRQKMWRYGKNNIFWDRPPAFPEGPNVEEWNVNGVSSTHEETATLAYSEKPPSPSHAPPGPTDAHYHARESPSSPWPQGSVEEPASGPSARKGRRWPRGRHVRSPQTAAEEESQDETDGTVAPESGEERDPDPWSSLYPAITSDGARQRYKEEFDANLRRYKQLCAQMDTLTDHIQQLSKELDLLQEGSTQYQGVAEEYNRLKDLKRAPDYQAMKMESRSLRKKLFHIKRMVSEYDKCRG
ncbi:occludin-like isoform X2 [Anolis carolinensis]|uniref:occludin-like isoform X2 n=1 Tax=Anolis carolinensis TaxID=28377 RepID=UPI002F2B3FAF